MSNFTGMFHCPQVFGAVVAIVCARAFPRVLELVRALARLEEITHVSAFIHTSNTYDLYYSFEVCER